MIKGGPVFGSGKIFFFFQGRGVRSWWNRKMHHTLFLFPVITPQRKKHKKKNDRILRSTDFEGDQKGMGLQLSKPSQ